MIEVIVKNILFFAQAAAPGYTLFLQARGDEERSLPIVVGQFEAQAIALALEQIKLERPMTHDLLSTVLTHMTGGLDSVVIKSLREGTFFAELNVRTGDEIQSLDARPSDAIALALRARVPIRVSQMVFVGIGKKQGNRVHCILLLENPKNHLVLVNTIHLHCRTSYTQRYIHLRNSVHLHKDHSHILYPAYTNLRLVCWRYIDSWKS